jgi:hypothetical protein
VWYKYNIREHVCDILEGGEDAFMRRGKNTVSTVNNNLYLQNNRNSYFCVKV